MERNAVEVLKEGRERSQGPRGPRWSRSLPLARSSIGGRTPRTRRPLRFPVSPISPGYLLRSPPGPPRGTTSTSILALPCRLLLVLLSCQCHRGLSFFAVELDRQHDDHNHRQHDPQVQFRLPLGLRHRCVFVLFKRLARFADYSSLF